MSKYNLPYLFKRQFIDLLAVCELPLNEPCNANKTRIGCTLQDCCFFMDACYQKTVPGHIIVFYSLIAVLIILFWILLGFWFYKYRKQKQKLADIENENRPDEIGTSSKTQEKGNQAETSHVKECRDETGWGCRK
ncbi:testis-expressed protein 29 [Hyla sarda]|uniref:testis-expressed protein 29 n=1 Tax=Hyla sarda TaxID=327740 RepID=UPI0024C38FC8|nr:testis-expressed protein 29 [Hyla sarda]